MKANLLSAIFLLVSLFAQAQNTNTWQGGHPGHENDWNTAANWSLGEVPNPMHDVAIPNAAAAARHFPVLDGTIAEVNSLKMLPGAELTLKNGALVSLPTSTVFAPVVKGYWDDKGGHLSAIANHANR